MSSLVPYCLCSVQDVKENLGIPSSNTTMDNLIIRKINAATDMIENFTGRRFMETIYSNIEYDATNTNQMILKQRPVTDLSMFGNRNTSLNEGSWDDIDTNLYFVDSAAGVIDLNFTNSGKWNRYRVTYTAGYSIIPSDLAEAAATLASFMAQSPTGSVGAVKVKEEGQRRIEYYDNSSNQSGTADTALFRQLAIYGTLAVYCNEPILADK